MHYLSSSYDGTLAEAIAAVEKDWNALVSSPNVQKVKMARIDFSYYHKDSNDDSPCYNHIILFEVYPKTVRMLQSKIDKEMQLLRKRTLCTKHPASEHLWGPVALVCDEIAELTTIPAKASAQTKTKDTAAHAAPVPSPVTVLNKTMSIRIAYCQESLPNSPCVVRQFSVFQYPSTLEELEKIINDSSRAVMKENQGCSIHHTTSNHQWCCATLVFQSAKPKGNVAVSSKAVGPATAAAASAASSTK